MILSNINKLTGNKFRFDIQSAPYFSYHVQSVNLPSINSGESPMETPFSNQWQQGDKIIFEPLDVSFLVDEELRGWLEIWNWMRSYGFERDYEQYKPQSKVDATLTILTNRSVPFMEVKFEDVWPITLSEIGFASNVADEEEIISSVSFRYRNYTINKL